MHRSTFSPSLFRRVLIPATLLFSLVPAVCRADPWGSRALDYVLNFLLSGVIAIVLSLLQLLIHALSRRNTLGAQFMAVFTVLAIGLNLYAFARYTAYANRYDIGHFFKRAWPVLILLAALYTFAVRAAIKAFFQAEKNIQEDWF